ncbi:MAG: peptidase, partial [Pirellulaceae bacterium]|nr:peptidase [Pirellulaceae bacterium]
MQVGPAHNAVQLSGLPQATGSYTRRLIYRSTATGAGPYTLVGNVPNAAGSNFLDRGGDLGEQLDVTLLGVVRARPSARLMIDPGSVLKLEGARIEVTFGAQLIAEGNDGQQIIFTSKLDDRYGAGGTFDTNNDGTFGVDPGAAGPDRGHWSGLFIGQLGQLNLDHVYLAYGGGDNSKIEGTFKGFNVIEIHQATARIANSVIEQNDPGTGGQGPNDRFGRGPNDGATIFVRGAQPVILNNIIRDNADVAININVDTFTHDLLSDPGRTSGSIDQTGLYRDNRGPLVRGNRIANNGPVGSGGQVGTNGMEIRTAGVRVAPGQPAHGEMVRRGITLSTQSVWDDTDIVHILYDELRIPNFNTFGGLRLQSSPDESLVVKLWSPPVSGGVGNAINDQYNAYPTMGAGFTATGRPMEIEDRIGGVLHVVGQPGFPVILTSLHDDTVGAGLQPDGRLQTDTNNNSWQSTPSAGDWRSLRLEQYSHDRNVEIILEQESPTETAPGINASVETAQFLGELAASETSGDENYRMGFEIQGFLSSRSDIDVYTFTAQAGTEIWLDIDRTRYALDTVVEVLDADGRLVALSDNSTWETIDPELLYSNPLRIADTSINPLQKLAEQNQPRHVSGLIKEHWTTNERDAGMRVLLPGAAGQRSPYTIRVRSSSLEALDSQDQLQDPARVNDGLTSGVYQLQVRTREVDEAPGSAVRYSEIRYAQNGVELIGLPKSSPLLGEAMEDEWVAERENFFFFANTASNDSPFITPDTPGQRPQDLGNLLASDRAVISLAGSLSSSTDIDFYRFTVQYTAIPSGTQRSHAAVTFDMDYADELGRADTTITIFRVTNPTSLTPTYTPILISRDSNVADDRSGPVRPLDDLSGLKDLSRGSVGSLDPFVGTVHLPVGDYAVAVTSAGQLPTVLVPQPQDPWFPSASYAEVRLEPINSLVRIAEDRIGSYGGATAEAPLVPVLLDPSFDGQSVSPTNLWHVSNVEAFTSGH